MRTLFAPILIPPPPPPPNQSRLCRMTSEEDLKFGEAAIHDRRRDELPGIPTSAPPKARDQSANVAAAFVSPQICIMCCESKVSRPQVNVQLLKRSKVCFCFMASEPLLAAAEQF